MIRELKYGMFSLKEKGKSCFCVAGSESFLLSSLLIPFTVLLIEQDMAISCISRPGTGRPREANLKLDSVYEQDLNCSVVLLARAAGRATPGAHQDGRDVHVDPPHPHTPPSTRRGRRMQRGPQAWQGEQWLESASSATPGTA